jgi:hypothetical protein
MRFIKKQIKQQKQLIFSRARGGGGGGQIYL